MLREQISVLDDRLMVIAEEFGDWLDSSRRIDLLCIDSEANLVVVELKRTDDGGHMPYGTAGAALRGDSFGNDL
mgnify:CR=1 FL=1